MQTNLNCHLYKHHAKVSQIKTYGVKASKNKQNTDIKQRPGTHWAILCGKVVGGAPWGHVLHWSYWTLYYNTWLGGEGAWWGA